jgi:triosephosphate isomerase
VGHSERRRLFGETDEEVARKTRAALAAGLIPVVCVGESLEERERGDTRAVLERQFALGPGAIAAGEWGTLVLAYEPVWAIGTGRNATPEVAEAAHVLLRGLVRQHAGEARAGGQRIIYGGSVTAENAAAYFREEDVDGVLVGGASLKADAFLQIVTSASAEGAAQ